MPGHGRGVLFCYDSDDVGMRNLAVVALTDAGVAGKRAAAVFELSPGYGSRLRGRAHAGGSEALVRRRGRITEGVSPSRYAGAMPVGREVRGVV